MVCIIPFLTGSCKYAFAIASAIAFAHTPRCAGTHMNTTTPLLPRSCRLAIRARRAACLDIKHLYHVMPTLNTRTQVRLAGCLGNEAEIVPASKRILDIVSGKLGAKSLVVYE